MSWMVLLALLAGFVLLVYGAEILVKGAARLAAQFHVSKLVIGLTVVAFGTSAPELAVSVAAAWKGSADIALGNVVGSNIFNVLGILGLSALAAPLIVHKQLIRLDVPVMIALSVLVWLMGLNGLVSRWEGLLLVGGLIAYTLWSIHEGKKDARQDELEESDDRSGGWLWNSVLILLGLAVLVFGSRLLVWGAVELAKAVGVSELVIGLTIVAVGTSLPEMATSVLATLRGQRDIAIGNVVGSNIFNILAVLGISAAVAPAGINVAPAALNFDIPVMIAVAAVCLPVFFSGLITRREGFLFVLSYAAYATYLVLDSQQHFLRDEFTQVMVYGVLPGSFLLLALGFIDALRKRRAEARGERFDG